MPIGSIEQQLRPVRIGYVINPTNRSSLEKCAILSTYLWGGFYNPIIPVFKKLMRIPPGEFRERMTRTGLTQGYIKAFDPDYLVKLDDSNLSGINVGTAEVIDWSNLTLDHLQSDKVDIGISYPEVFHELIRNEFRYTRNDDLLISFPEIPARYSIFLKCYFGQINPTVRDELLQNYSDLPTAIIRRTISDFFVESSSRKNIFPRRLTAYQIHAPRSNHFRSEGEVFLLDATNPAHITEYWNLRAIGWNVFPAPLQIIEKSDFKDRIREFVDENFGQFANNPKIYSTTTFLKASAIPMIKLQDFVSSLAIPVDSVSSEPKVSLQHWYPRIWSDRARDKDGALPASCRVAEESHDFQEDKDEIHLKPLAPKFMSEHGYFEHAKFVNELSYRVYGFSKKYAEVLPEISSDKLRDIMRYWSLDSWRLANGLLNYLGDGHNSKILFSVPDGERTYQTWITTQGATEFRISPAGLVLKQILKQEEKDPIISLISIPGIIDFIENANKKSGGVILENQVKQELNRLKRQSRFINRDPRGFVEKMVDAGIIKLGAMIKCPSCSQSSWFEYSTLGSELECIKCNQKFYQPTNNPSSIIWAYKTRGPFSAVNSAYGSYTVLLSIRFVSQLLDLPLTMCPSYECEIKGKPIEVDLGMITGGSMLGQKASYDLFFECKTNNNFEKKDSQRMLTLHKLFPSALMVFSTLKKELSIDEKRLLVGLKNKMKKVQADYQDYYPLLILTKNELVADISLPYSWKGLGGKWATAASSYRGSRELENLCELTQDLYMQ